MCDTLWIILQSRQSVNLFSGECAYVGWTFWLALQGVASSLVSWVERARRTVFLASVPSCDGESTRIMSLRGAELRGAPENNTWDNLVPNR
jgi:hypothetical protein